MSNFNMLINATMRSNKLYHQLFNTQYSSFEVGKSLQETEMHQALIINADSAGFNFPADDDTPERLVKAFFCGVTGFLSRVKQSKPDEAVSCVLRDIDGAFKFGAIIEYTPNKTEPDEPGNWSYTMTLSEDEYNEIQKRKSVKEYRTTDETFKVILDKIARDYACLTFKRDSFIYHTCILVIDTLIQILDHEAVEGQVVDIEYEGYFTASVAIENDKKVYSITPAFHLKNVIKNDLELDNITQYFSQQ